jgi:hypothetical protein
MWCGVVERTVCQGAELKRDSLLDSLASEVMREDV